MDKEKIHNLLVELIAEFQSDTIAGNKDYVDSDFNFQSFMAWLVRNNP